ncbi:uncharacterized protein M421DRAFT_376100 [Didymella exigua CBS 183.55]|uniref:Uncharacterized protein n=1 Tax=Didymella exigua CBS 183.55 TaxID=1150837 RepID=A0A6A5RST7_9PLEO|nr:uncharacterized protein M421DRAFT_376100 [Didymella exigua CBS 183.55]KAF1930523.1 hypothetical protein M421DRAFT_376100 [Didymella exigua CBS 183.55]
MAPSVPPRSTQGLGLAPALRHSVAHIIKLPLILVPNRKVPLSTPRIRLYHHELAHPRDSLEEFPTSVLVVLIWPLMKLIPICLGQRVVRLMRHTCREDKYIPHRCMKQHTTFLSTPLAQILACSPQPESLLAVFLRVCNTEADSCAPTRNHRHALVRPGVVV